MYTPQLQMMECIILQCSRFQTQSQVDAAILKPGFEDTGASDPNDWRSSILPPVRTLWQTLSLETRTALLYQASIATQRRPVGA